MFLMLKDIPIMQFQIDDAEYKVLNPRLLPHALKKILSANSTLQAVIAVRDFLAGRVLPLSRSNAKQLYDLVGNDQSQTSENLIRISLLCHSVSINDSYWTRAEEERITWREVNVRTNHLNSIFTEVALKGIYASLEGSMITPELTTDGTAAKGWKREDGRLWLYKKGPRAEIEVMVSRLLDHFNIDHVQYYSTVDTDHEYCCKCCCLSNEERHIVSAADVLEKQEPDYNMWIVDYLISNVDRHNRNFGYYAETDTTKILGPHPLFDHDHAFHEQAMRNKQFPYKAFFRYTMQAAAHEAMRHVNIFYTGEFNRNDFMTQLQYESFMDRLQELQIRRK